MRGASLAKLISDLREELRRANTPNASPEDTPTLRRTLNHVARALYYDTNWPFLQRMFPAITLNAGQQYYDKPDGLEPDRIIRADVFWGNQYEALERGIGFEEYNSYDPAQNNRSSPIMRWDVKFTGTTDQIEVWPLPGSDAQSLRFFGVQAMPDMKNMTDICPLESEIVVLYAAAELAAKDSPDKEAKLSMARELLRQLKSRANSAGYAGQFQNGLGNYGTQRIHPKAYLRVRG